jgi:hypothetical protein
MSQSANATLGTSFLLLDRRCNWLAIQSLAKTCQSFGKSEALARFLTEEGVELADAAKGCVDARVGAADVGADFDEVSSVLVGREDFAHAA